MMVRHLVLAGLTVLVPAVTSAQQAPYKLVLTAYQNTVVIDYPTAARCRAALQAVQDENAERKRMAAESQARTQGGVVIPAYVSAFCLPG